MTTLCGSNGFNIGSSCKIDSNFCRHLADWLILVALCVRANLCDGVTHVSLSPSLTICIAYN